MGARSVYILGLSRVGSTLLDLTLGSHSPFVGLGEVFQVIRPDFNRFENKAYCSCGQIIDECPFWGVVADRLRKNKDAGLKERYELVFEVFREVFGESSVPVDSSKLLDVLKVLRKLNKIDTRVIYLIRDVRAWTVSRLNNRMQSPGYFEKNGNYYKKLKYHYGWKAKTAQWALPVLTRRASYYFWLWYYQNRQIKNFLAGNNIAHLPVGYEEVAMTPDRMIPKIFRYLGEEKGDGNFSSENSQSHILVGNTRKTDAKRRQGIVYDYRWMYRSEWLLPAALFRNIMAYNSANVYHNLQEEKFWQK